MHLLKNTKSLALALMIAVTTATTATAQTACENRSTIDVSLVGNPQAVWSVSLSTGSSRPQLYRYADESGFLTLAMYLSAWQGQNSGRSSYLAGGSLPAQDLKIMSQVLDSISIPYLKGYQDLCSRPGLQAEAKANLGCEMLPNMQSFIRSLRAGIERWKKGPATAADIDATFVQPMLNLYDGTWKVSYVEEASQRGGVLCGNNDGLVLSMSACTFSPQGYAKVKSLCSGKVTHYQTTRTTEYGASGGYGISN